MEIIELIRSGQKCLNYGNKFPPCHFNKLFDRGLSSKKPGNISFLFISFLFIFAHIFSTTFVDKYMLPSITKKHVLYPETFLWYLNSM